MILKDYQKEVAEKTFKILIENNEKDIKYKKRVLIQMPTGTGKTYVLGNLAYKFYKYKAEHDINNRHVLILSHRKIIIEQILSLFKKNVIATIEQLEYGDHANPPITISTIQRAINILKKNKRKYGLIIVDEAHHIASEQYQFLFELIGIENTELLGFTATPLRLDGKSLYPTFNELITSKQIIEFIKEGHLSNYEHYVSSTYKIDDNQHLAIIDKATNDFDLDKYEKIFSRNTLIADIEENYKKYCNNNKTLIYAININHAKAIIEKLKHIEGCKVDIIHSKDGDKKTRNEIITNFKKGAKEIGSINTLINVEMFTEGFDLCALDNVILARPTYSLSLYLQMMGRALRRDNNNPKKIAKIIDIVNNAQFHGYISTFREWSLHNIYEVSKFEDDNIIENKKTRNKPIQTVEAIVSLKDSSKEIINIKKRTIVYRPYLQSLNRELKLEDKPLERAKINDSIKAIYDYKKNQKTSNDIIILKPEFLIIGNDILNITDKEYQVKVFTLSGIIQDDVEYLKELIFKANQTINKLKVNIYNNKIKFNELAYELNVPCPKLIEVMGKTEIFKNYINTYKLNNKISSKNYNFKVSNELADYIRKYYIPQK